MKTKKIVQYRVWQSTDKCTLQTQVHPTNEFVDLLCERLKELKPHHFIAKEQSAFVKQKKENLAFVAQDAAQSFHYNNDQCTVYPVVYYYCEQNKILHKSLVVLSDSLVHDTAAFLLIQKTIVEHVKKICNGVEKIIYVTDGAAQHYKNRFLMANLLNHERES